MPLSNAPWGEIVAGALSGGAVTQLFNWLKQRGADRKIARDEVAVAARELVRTALDSATGQIDRLEATVENLRRDMTKMRADHATELAAMSDRHAACERLTAELRAEIDRLMKGPVAAYPPIQVQPKPDGRRRRSKVKTGATP